MDKRLKPEDMIALSRLLYKAGFLVHGMFIFGYPMAEGIDFSMPAKERIRRFKKFIKSARLDTVKVLLPAPLPGTELTRRLKEQNRIFPKDLVGWEYYDGNFPLFIPDAPMTPEEMQASSHKIMGRFYRFKHMFHIGLHILWFPIFFFYLPNLKAGWRKWYRIWANQVTRFGVWELIEDHERRCDVDGLRRLLERRSGRGRAGVERELAGMLHYDAEIRRLMVAQGGLEAEMLEFLLGRPVKIVLDLIERGTTP